MTKRRAPLSIDAALARIAGHMPRGWDDMAEVAARNARTVRGWGDPDRTEQMPMDAAIALDLAFQAAGGEGAPIFEAYAALLDMAGVHRFASRHALGRHTAHIIRETGEASAALVLAAQPGASASHIRETRREVEEAIAALKRALPMLDDQSQSSGQAPDQAPDQASAQAPEQASAQPP